MENSKHTEGNWRIALNNETVVVCDKTNGTIPTISRCNDTINLLSYEEQKANAKLMAASKDLLEACTMAFNLCDMRKFPTESELTELKVKCLQAINKATK